MATTRPSGTLTPAARSVHCRTAPNATIEATAATAATANHPADDPASAAAADTTDGHASTTSMVSNAPTRPPKTNRAACLHDRPAGRSAGTARSGIGVVAETLIGEPPVVVTIDNDGALPRSTLSAVSDSVRKLG